MPRHYEDRPRHMERGRGSNAEYERRDSHGRFLPEDDRGHYYRHSRGPDDFDRDRDSQGRFLPEHSGYGQRDERDHRGWNAEYENRDSYGRFAASPGPKHYRGGHDEYDEELDRSRPITWYNQHEGRNWDEDNYVPRRAGPHHQMRHDPEYQQWRDEQLANLDRDYEAWRGERYKKFSDEFNNWRTNRPKTSSESGSGESNNSNKNK